MSKALVAANEDPEPFGGARSAREAERREAFMRTAAGVFRQYGLAGATMEQVAAASGVTKVVLYRRFPSKDALIQGIFAETLRRLNAQDAKPWKGYGGGMRKSLAAARSFEDGFILLVRHGDQNPAYQASHALLRRRTGQRLRGLLWYPDQPPPRTERPALLELSLEPMISFCNDALAYWVERGEPAKDEMFLRWCGQMMRAWRHNAAELLNLDSPEQEWPFDTEGLTL
ncbi:MAG: TetR/AcrR family transcriptional regulator [Alphaproteobacteria bacterium]|nr:TetR/AcrR family transcriptional regulator [Alphaproteobacteria bacterium]MBU1515273.1 TetR/AcrR family transcriptional regulator [Alphaproteobacteria bacterium]MBU2092403.1 TetR/AcrR family transcriptional regulator [Alphaproteobacteria bacterium]MBU2152997.1 TetR/AcrR family transcriptional regulator [Alphaproteobacteria bacterium]MBU2305828.1 TetR/AcrR family transcriptional regulator [Alphaproteobacteria bacterium]